MFCHKITNSDKIDSSKAVSYEPEHFIRCHSKDNDSTDVKTPIWGVMFEPDPDDDSKASSHVATCGDNTDY